LKGQNFIALVAAVVEPALWQHYRHAFRDTYNRPWTAADGDPLESTWKVHVEQCDNTHPPFIVRSLSMLDAAAQVEKDQADEIRKQQRNDVRAALIQENSVESQIALEQLEQQTPQSAPRSTWTSSLPDVTAKLRKRIIVEHPLFGCYFQRVR
jgi:hypothetical protein